MTLLFFLLSDIMGPYGLHTQLLKIIFIKKNNLMWLVASLKKLNSNALL